MKKKKGTILFLVFSFLWVFIPVALGFDGLKTGSFWYTAGRVFALVGYSLFSLNIILASKNEKLNRLIPVLNAFLWHHYIGFLAFVFITLHPMFLSLSYLEISVLAVFEFFLPSLRAWEKTLGSIALLLTYVALFFTFYFRPRYERWKKLHLSLAVVMVLSSLHSFFAKSSFIFSNPVLRYYLLITGLGSVIFLLISKFNVFSMKKIFKVVNTERPHSKIFRIDMELKEGEFTSFVPGQFAWFVFESEDLPREEHPFSFISSPLELPKLSVAIKALGDYTTQLDKVKPEDTVRVRGPFGEFSYKNSQNKKQIWIAGGIGITPFVSMAKYLYQIGFKEGHNIVLYWSVREREEAVFDKVFYEIAQSFSQNFKYRLVVSSKEGRISFGFLQKEVKDLKDRDVFVCGPPLMIVDVIKQFMKEGWTKERIFKEKFTL